MPIAFYVQRNTSLNGLKKGLRWTVTADYGKDRTEIQAVTSRNAVSKTIAGMIRRAPKDSL